MENLIDTIESQYANSPRIMALIDSYNESVDPSSLIDDLYDKIWNIDTAIGWGLDLWGRIVVISRVIEIIVDKEYFWFKEAGASSNGWGQAPWYRPINPDAENFYLTDSAFRLLILVKAMSNISDGTIATYNRMLMMLFPGRGNAYVIDNFNMTITLNFDFDLLPYELSIIENSGAFPAPCGQKILIGIGFWYDTDSWNDPDPW